MDTSSEVWKDAPGWEGIYQVSSHGRVKSLPRTRNEKSRHGGYVTATRSGRVLRPGYTQKGYQVVVFSDLPGGRKPRSVRLHRIVCHAFHGAPPEGHEVAHGDGTRDNNRADNLRWATHYDNIQDAVAARKMLAREVCHR